MTNESEAFGLEQTFFDEIKELCEIGDNLTTEQVKKILWERLTSQEQEIIDACCDEIEKLLLYGSGDQPRTIGTELTKILLKEIVDIEAAARIEQHENEIVKILAEKLEIMTRNQRDADSSFDDLYKELPLHSPDWEAPEEVTRGLRDRSPTICTRSARVNQSSGARDALQFGCRPGLLLFPPKKSRHRGVVEVARASCR